MANEIVPFDTAVPAHLAGRIGKSSALAVAMEGGIGGGVDYARISIKASRFRIVQGGSETLLPDITLAVVIIGANAGVSKAFYASAWNPDVETTGPDCYTMDGIRPDTLSPQPQNDLCATCPHNAWGSKVTDAGTQVKACADKKRLAVVAADDPSGNIYLLEVTAGALKNFKQYNRDISMRGIIPEIARTIISFDTEASYPKLKFNFGGFLDDAAQIIIDPLIESAKVREITGIASAVAALSAPALTLATSEIPPKAETETAAAFGKPTVQLVSETPAPATPEPAPSAFGKPAAAPTETTQAAQPVAEEPAAAVTTDKAGTEGLSTEIAALMAQVADDA